MVAPNGARLMPGDHAALPLTSAVLAETAVACAEAGATAIHVHVRDADGRHSLDPARYAQVMSAISACSKLEIQISTEAAGKFDVAAQRHCLLATGAPEASVALREIERASNILHTLYNDAQRSGTRIQHILYDAEDARRLLHYVEAGVIPGDRLKAIFVLGRYSDGQVALPKDLDPFLKVTGASDMHWSVCAFGPNEHECVLAALSHGGHARIGFENSRHRADGTTYPDNATSVIEFVAKAALAGFIPRTPDP